MTQATKPPEPLAVARAHNQVQLRHLIGSKWSRIDGKAAFVHYGCIARNAETVLLRSVLTPFDDLLLPWRDLRNVAVWAPGWIPCTPPSDTDDGEAR